MGDILSVRLRFANINARLVALSQLYAITFIYCKYVYINEMTIATIRIFVKVMPGTKIILVPGYALELAQGPFNIESLELAE